MKKNSDIMLDHSAESCNNSDMIRNSILNRMKELGLTVYQIAKMLEGKVPRRTVYSYLSDGRETSTQVASEIMKALKLKIKPIKKRGERPRKEV